MPVAGITSHGDHWKRMTSLGDSTARIMVSLCRGEAILQQRSG